MNERVAEKPTRNPFVRFSWSVRSAGKVKAFQSSVELTTANEERWVNPISVKLDLKDYILIFIQNKVLDLDCTGFRKLYNVQY